MKNKLITLFLFFFIIFSFLFVIPQVDALVIHYTGFEDGNLGQNYTTSWITTHDYDFWDGSYFYVTDFISHSGTKCFTFDSGVGGNHIGWVNFSYSEDDYMTNLTFNHYMQNKAGSEPNIEDLVLYNDNMDIVLHFEWDKDNDQEMNYHDWLGNKNRIGDDSSSWTYCGFNINSNDSITYFIDDFEVTDTPRNILDDMRITSMLVTWTGFIDFGAFDNINMTVSAELEGEGGGYGDLSGYNVLCEGDEGLYLQVAGERYIENEFGLSLTTTIKAVDLFVNANQINLVTGELTDYSLFINGLFIGNPKYVFQTGTIDYTIRWMDFTATITNDKPLFEFACNEYLDIGDTPNWWYGLGVGYGGNFKSHNNYNLHGNNLYDGNNNNYGLAMCFYYTKPTVPNPNYNDTVTTQPIDRDIYQEYENIVITGTVSILTENTYIRLYQDGDQFLGQGYGEHAGKGRLVEDYGFISSFVPNSQDYNGTWNVSLWRNFLCVASHTFTVIDRDENDYNCLIYTSYNPSEINDEFYIGWLWNNSDYEGTIIITNKPYLDNDYFGIVKSGITTDGTILYSWDKDQVLYFIMCAERNGTFYPCYVHEHFVGTQGVNEINTDSEIYYLNTERSTIPKAWVNVYGRHSYVSANVKLMINDAFYYNIGDSPFDYVLDFTETGYYNIEMVLYSDDDTKLVLANTSFIILLESEQPEGGIWDNIYLRWFGGLILFLIIMCIPYMVRKNDVHWSVNLLFGCSAIVINIGVGLWDWWVIVFISIIAFAITVMVYVNSRK